MNNSSDPAFSCTVQQIGSSPKDTWTISITGDELHLKCARTQREVILDRRKSDHRMTFPIFSRADIVIEDCLGEQWLLSCESSHTVHTERIERWWSWPTQRPSNESSPAPATEAIPETPRTNRSTRPGSPCEVAGQTELDLLPSLRTAWLWQASFAESSGLGLHLEHTRCDLRSHGSKQNQ